MVSDYLWMPFYPLFTKYYFFPQSSYLLSKFLLLELWSTHQHHHFLEVVRNVGSQTSSQTYWTRICIFKRLSPGDSYAYLSLRSMIQKYFMKGKRTFQLVILICISCTDYFFFLPTHYSHLCLDAKFSSCLKNMLVFLWTLDWKDFISTKVLFLHLHLTFYFLSLELHPPIEQVLATCGYLESN